MCTHFVLFLSAFEGCCFREVCLGSHVHIGQELRKRGHEFERECGVNVREGLEGEKTSWKSYN